jgi:nucleoside-diphosphate-sugar epimerase
MKAIKTYLASVNWLPRITPAVLLRAAVDAMLIYIMLILAVLLRFFIAFGLNEFPTNDTNLFLTSFLSSFSRGVWLLAPLTVVCLWVLGVYSHKRAYRGRYKALAILHGVVLGFLIYGYISVFVYTEHVLGRSVLVMAAVLSGSALVGVRLWRVAWEAINRIDNKFTLSPATAQRISRVLVIGGAGYIGSALLPKLLERGYRVRLLDLMLYGRDPVKDILEHPNLEVVQADFRHLDNVVEAMQHVDAVIHLGALVGDPACAIDEDLTLDINLIATRSIVEVAKGQGVQRFIFASTCSVYGASDELLDEQSSLNPVSLYAKSKIAAERIVLKMAGPQFAPTILRFGTIYGLSGRTRFDLVINLLTAKAVTEGKITVSGGDQWRPFVHVDDAASGVVCVLESPVDLVHNQIFNVGSNAQNYTIEGAAKVIHTLVPTATIVDMGADGDRRNYRVSFDKIHKTLHFAPRWTLERGIQQVIDAFRSGQVRNYKDASYSNVKFLTEEGLNLLEKPAINWGKVYIEQTETKVQQ